MKKNYLEIKIQDKIAWIKINREEKLNALNISMLEEIRENLIDLGKNKNVLVTGGNGMIGRQLVSLLEKRGANVTVADLPIDL